MNKFYKLDQYRPLFGGATDWYRLDDVAFTL